MRVAIIQSSYIPWKGYFDLIHAVDRLVFLDDVQFTTRDWRTRNRIKGPAAPQWLSIPAGSRTDRLICDVRLEDAAWQRKHWSSIHHCYSKTPFYKAYRDRLAEIYLAKPWQSLSDFNQHFTRSIAQWLGIATEFRDSREFQVDGKRQHRLINLLLNMGATHYVSGPSARGYIDPIGFAEAGLTLSYHDYPTYPEYPQLHPPFEHAVSIIDLLFNAGPKASHYIWGWRKN